MISVDEMRKHFEECVRKSDRLKHNTPLAIMEINGTFANYMDADTDTLWIGFALGMRVMEKIK